MFKNIEKVSTASIVSEIELAQSIQKKYGVDSEMGTMASKKLAPLFKEMARRQADNSGEADWKKWKWYSL